MEKTFLRDTYLDPERADQKRGFFKGFESIKPITWKNAYKKGIIHELNETQKSALDSLQYLGLKKMHVYGKDWLKNERYITALEALLIRDIPNKSFKNAFDILSKCNEAQAKGIYLGMKYEDTLGVKTERDLKNRIFSICNGKNYTKKLKKQDTVYVDNRAIGKNSGPVRIHGETRFIERKGNSTRNFSESDIILTNVGIVSNAIHITAQQVNFGHSALLTPDDMPTLFDDESDSYLSLLITMHYAKNLNSNQVQKIAKTFNPGRWGRECILLGLPLETISQLTEKACYLFCLLHEFGITTEECKIYSKLDQYIHALYYLTVNCKIAIETAIEIINPFVTENGTAKIRTLFQLWRYGVTCETLAHYPHWNWQQFNNLYSLLVHHSFDLYNALIVINFSGSINYISKIKQSNPVEELKGDGNLESFRTYIDSLKLKEETYWKELRTYIDALKNETKAIEAKLQNHRAHTPVIETKQTNTRVEVSEIKTQQPTITQESKQQDPVSATARPILDNTQINISTSNYSLFFAAGAACLGVLYAKPELLKQAFDSASYLFGFKK